MSPFLKGDSAKPRGILKSSPLRGAPSLLKPDTVKRSTIIVKYYQ